MDSNSVHGDVPVGMWFLDRLELYKTTKPYMITFDTTGFNGAKTNHSYSKHTVRVTDARHDRARFSIDTHGFEFLDWPTALDSVMFDNDAAVKSKYYPELLARFQAQFPQFSHVHVFAHLVGIISRYIPQRFNRIDREGNDDQTLWESVPRSLSSMTLLSTLIPVSEFFRPTLLQSLIDV
jgi:hypothetical protein